MVDHLQPPSDDAIPAEIAGLRMTKQRREVYRSLMGRRDHPTAQEVFLRVKDDLPSISLATVYNCLEAMVEHGIVRQVNFERGPSRYCSNLAEHGHFHDETTGAICDVKFKPGVNLADFLDLPDGAMIDHIDLTLHGKLSSSH